MGLEYTEREAPPEARDRGRALGALAGGHRWAFLVAQVDGEDGIRMKVETGDRMSRDDLKAVLAKTLEALP
jgi:hypothetical protein